MPQSTVNHSFGVIIDPDMSLNGNGSLTDMSKIIIVDYGQFFLQFIMAIPHQWL